MSFADIPLGDEAPEIVTAVIEIPQGSSNKYEYDPGIDAFVLDRVLYSPLYYPTDYGWVAGTLSEDGDPLDVLVFVSHPTFPGCVVRVRPVGVLHMHDEEGEDFKIIAVAATDPRYREVANLDGLPEHIRREIVHFFSIYKQLEHKETEILGWLDIERAHSIISLAAERASASFEPRR
ncbi:MAG: inorganic diphosphatase [Armatimonadota bacterium]